MLTIQLEAWYDFAVLRGVSEQRFSFLLGGRGKKRAKSWMSFHGHMTRCELRTSNHVEQTQKFEDVRY